MEAALFQDTPALLAAQLDPKTQKAAEEAFAQQQRSDPRQLASELVSCLGSGAIKSGRAPARRDALKDSRRPDGRSAPSASGIRMRSTASGARSGSAREWARAAGRARFMRRRRGRSERRQPTLARRVQ